MPATVPLIVLVGFWLFAVGTVVGSFLNVCIYRIPWQKSVIWPGSHCPRCWGAIAPRTLAAPRAYARAPAWSS